MKYSTTIVIALTAWVLAGCAICPKIDQRTLDQLSRYAYIDVKYCGNKDGYAYLRWAYPSVPFRDERCGKIPLEDARKLSGWNQSMEFPYTKDRAEWIAGWEISDLVLPPP